MNTNELEHEFLQVFIFIKKVQLKITWSRNILKFNTNYSKGMKRLGITNVIKSLKIAFKITLFSF